MSRHSDLVESVEWKRKSIVELRVVWRKNIYPCLGNDLRLSIESFQLHPPFMMMYDEKKSQSTHCKEDVLLIYLHYLLNFIALSL